MRTQYETVADLPKALWNFLFSDFFDGGLKKIVARFHVSDDARDQVEDTLINVLLGHLTLDQALEKINKLLVPSFVPADIWPDIVKGLCEDEWWPLRDVFGEELQEVLKRTGCDPTGWNSYRVILEPMSYTMAAREIASAAGFTLIDDPLRERLRELLVSKLKGIRDDAKVRDVLDRPGSQGGMGLEPGMSQRTFQLIDDMIESVELMSEADYDHWKSEQAKSVADQNEKHLLAQSDDEAEITRMKQKVSSFSAAPSSELEASIEAMYASLPDKPADAYLASRLKQLISSRFRDVRNSIEIKQLLQRDVKVGGMGMTKEAAEKAATLIDQGYQQSHEKILSEEKQRLESAAELQRKKIDERKQQEATDRMKWYEERLAMKRLEDQEKQRLTNEMKRAVHPMDAKEQVVEERRFGSLVSATGAPAPIKVSAATAALQEQASTAMRPRMDDVRSARVPEPPVSRQRLTGPVQELREMRIVDFRRLSPDPEEAGEKIFQKIETLRQESFERLHDGIAAWQQSEVQRSYLALVAEAFRAGRPVAEVAEERHGMDPDIPTSREINAILSLNSKLHY